MRRAPGVIAAEDGFRQPRPMIRWLAIVVAAAGWFVSLELLQQTLNPGGTPPFLRAVCGNDLGEAANPCSAVLQSSYAYIALGDAPSALRVPAAGVGMIYFGFLLVWFLFVGPPGARGWLWHIPVLLLVIGGVGQSIGYLYIMQFELQQWCGGCVVAHGLNGVLATLALLAFPWRAARADEPVHPRARLAMATLTCGTLLGLLHFAILIMLFVAGLQNVAQEQLVRIVDDPEFIRWDYDRRIPVEPFLRADELFDGNPVAAHTVVVFSDFRCPHCAEVHRTLARLLAEHPDQFRVAYRHAPQDAECNPDPNWRAAGHPSACAAARAVEAARVTGGAAGAHALRGLLYERQRQLPRRPWRELSEAERSRFAEWAAELRLDRTTFEAAFESSAVAERVAEDVALAGKLGLRAMPVVFLDWKRVQNPGKRATWEALLELQALEPQSAEPQP